MRVFVITLLTVPLLTGFVLLGKREARLPVTPDSPTVTLLWSTDGKAPKITEKEAYKGGIYANHTDADLTPILIQEAIDQWNSIPGSYLRFSVENTSGDLTPDSEDGQNFIVVKKAPSASVAAYAAPNVDPETSIIKDCDIVINDVKTTASSLLETLTHELGHCVGLGHPHTNYGAIMSYSRQGKSYRLSSDDKAGAIFLYPDPDYTQDQPRELVGCGVINTKGRRSQPGPWLYYVIMIPVLATVYRNLGLKLKKSKNLNR